MFKVVSDQCKEACIIFIPGHSSLRLQSITCTKTVALEDPLNLNINHPMT